MGDIIGFCHRGSDGQKVVVSELRAFWNGGDEDKFRKYASYTQSDIVSAMNYLIDNSHFKVGNDIFRQVIGIPMGTDPAPFMANLFLYHYERNYVLDLKKNNVHDARLFNNVFRFIDDLCALNDGGLFERHHKNIYPEEMELKKENDGSMNASFLDLDLSIVNSQFSLKLFDKRDAFPFNIVRMPYISSNIPSTIFFSTITSELLRIAICSTGKNDFVHTAQILMVRMIKQGASNRMRLTRSLRRLFGNHSEHFMKFFESPELFILSILPNALPSNN